MSACCMSDCKNRHCLTKSRQCSNGKVKLCGVPSGYRPIQAHRKHLWLQAIKPLSGGTEEPEGNEVCGAHFVSGESSMEHDCPDIVASVCTSVKQSHSPKKKPKWFYGHRKRKRRTTNVRTEEKTTLSADSPLHLPSSVLTEETQTISSPSLPKEGETLTEEAETETEIKTIKLQTASSPNKTSPSFKVPAGVPKLDKRIPIVLLKRVFVNTGEYQCDECNQNFTIASQLVKHKRLHEEGTPMICEICGNLFTRQEDFAEHQREHEHSFLCNMCNRSFTTSHNLKRHKLLHVRDGRKCSRCGVLFCQRHNHTFFLPQTESEQDSAIIENDLLEKSELDPTADDIQSTATCIVGPTPPNPDPLSKTRNALPPASHTRILSEIPPPLLKKSFAVPHPPPQGPRYSSNVYLTTSIQPHPPQSEFPPSLKMFSPQYLTSALLEVKRNYEYILSKSRDFKTSKDILKEEQCQPLLLNSTDEQSVEPNKKARTAYDLETVL